VRPGSSSSANALEGGGDTGSGDDNSGYSSNSITDNPTR